MAIVSREDVFHRNGRGVALSVRPVQVLLTVSVLLAPWYGPLPQLRPIFEISKSILMACFLTGTMFMVLTRGSLKVNGRLVLVTFSLFGIALLGWVAGDYSGWSTGIRVIFGPLFALASIQTLGRRIRDSSLRVRASFVYPPVISAVVSSAVGLWTWRAGLMGGIVGLSSSANAFANSLGCSVVPAVGLSLTARSWRNKGAWLISAAVIAYAVVNSSGRTGVFVISASVAAFLFFVLLSKTRIPVWMEAIGGVGWVLILSLGTWVLNTSRVPIRLAGREAVWALAYQLIKQNLILGNGWSSLPTVTESIWGFPLHGHNVLISFTTATGVVGLVVLCMVIYWLGSAAMRGWRSCPDVIGSSLMASLTGSLLICLVESYHPFGPFFVVTHWWYYLSLLLCSPEYPKASSRGSWTSGV